MDNLEQDISLESQDTEFDFDAAFKEAEGELNDELNFEDSSEDTDVEEEEHGPDETENTETDDAESDDTQEDKEVTDEVDYRAVYQRMANENQTLKRQYDDLASQYYSWKGRVEAEHARKQEQKETETPAKNNEMPADLAEFMDLYPDMSAPIQKLIDARVTERVSAVEQNIQRLIDEKVAPINKHVHDTEAQAHFAAIKSAHPDYAKYVQDGSLEAWVNSLPSYHQIGAKYTIANGNTQEVIQLYDAFKQARNITKQQDAEPKIKKDTNPSIVNKVKDAMSVPSAASELPTSTAKEPTDPDKLFNYYAKQLLNDGM